MLAPRGFGRLEEHKMVVERLHHYLQVLETVHDKPTTLTVLIGTDVADDDCLITERNDVRLVRLCSPTRNALKFTVLAISVSFKLKLKPKVLLSSDVRFAFISSAMYRLFFRDVFLQTQIHGMYQSLTPSYLGFLRKPYSLFVARNSNSIRFVSENQLHSFPLKVKSRFPSIVIAPIPYLKKLDSRLTENNLRSIGFVGRLHKERGLDGFIKLARELEYRGLQTPIVIIGDGPQRKYFQKKIRESYSGPIHDFGWLGSRKLNDAWADIGVLAVTAPFESFGVTIREALLHGVRVVALRNASSMAVEREFPSSVFTSLSISELADTATNWCNTRIEREEWGRIQRALLNEERQGTLKVVSSWASHL